MRELSLHILDIVENGITANGDLIKISINENRNENILSIEISDNGTGISDNMLEKISDPFITSRTTRRVGLGLSYAKAVIEAHGGKIDIKSQAKKGTTVILSIPLEA